MTKLPLNERKKLRQKLKKNYGGLVKRRDKPEKA
jgi:hypothetical protein